MLDADPFTGMFQPIMAERRGKLCFIKNPGRVNEHRTRIIRLANAAVDGDKVLCPLNEVQNFEQIFAVRTPPANNAKFKKRAGARKVKDFERAQAMADGSLTPESATLYRAMSARGNYLSQDRVDVSYSTKELCRHLFST